MRIRSFSVSRFRSINEAKKITLSSPTILIGKNNEGKSNFLAALLISIQAINSGTAMRIYRNSSGAVVRIGRTLVTDKRRNSGYIWERDYPKNLVGSKSPKYSSFVVEFEMTDNEVDEFYAKTNSKINTILPIEVRFDDKNTVEFSVRKQGKAKAVLDKKIGDIVEYLAKKVDINYIPAIRTEQNALRTIRALVGQQFASRRRQSTRMPSRRLGV